MKLVEFVVPAVIPAFLSLYFDFFDGFIQAYVFVFLTSLFISEAIEQNTAVVEKTAAIQRTQAVLSGLPANQAKDIIILGGKKLCLQC